MPFFVIYIHPHTTSLHFTRDHIHQSCPHTPHTFILHQQLCFPNTGRQNSPSRFTPNPPQIHIQIPILTLHKSMGLKNLLFHRKKKPVTTNDVVSPQTTTTKSIPQIEDELTQVFKKFDINNDGKISSSELGSIMGTLGHRPTDEELESMIKSVDADGDGFIDLNEFIELNTKGVGSSEVLESLKEAFSVFDIDRNGLISAEELQKVLGRLEEECSIGECRKMIDGVDVDGDGMISFEEFRVMMMSGMELKES